MTADELAQVINDKIPAAVEPEEHADMPALTTTTGRLVEVCRVLRDDLGKNFLSAVTAIDYLGYGEQVAGYFGTERGRDINATGSWGTPQTVEAPAKRFGIFYHLAHVGADGGSPARVRVRVDINEGETVPTVIPIWPTADWHEREQFDMMGIEFAGHPNLKRLIMPSDWAGHPLRKDYPIGGEPVAFTDAE